MSYKEIFVSSISLFKTWPFNITIIALVFFLLFKRQIRDFFSDAKIAHARIGKEGFEFGLKRNDITTTPQIKEEKEPTRPPKQIGLIEIKISKQDLEKLHKRKNEKLVLEEVYEMAFKDAEEGRNKEALAKFTTIINNIEENHPKTAEVYYNRGFARFNIEDFDGAFNDYTKAIEIKTDFGHPYNNRGNIFIKKKKYDLAIGDFSKAINYLNDDNIKAIAYANRGLAKIEDGNYREGIEDINKAISIDKSYADAYYNKGNAELKLSDFKGAIKRFTKAIELDVVQEKKSRAFINRAYAKRMSGDYPLTDILSDIDIGLELNPTNYIALNNRAALRVLNGLYEEAIEDANRVIDSSEDEYQISVALTHRALGKECLGDYQGAIKDLHKALSIFEGSDEDRGGIYHNLGKVFMSMGEYDKAIPFLNIAISLNPQWAENFRKRGVCHHFKERYKDAICDLEKAISLTPDFPAEIYDLIGLQYLYLIRESDEEEEKRNYALEAKKVCLKAYDISKGKVVYNLACVCARLNDDNWTKYLEEVLKGDNEYKYDRKYICRDVDFKHLQKDRRFVALVGDCKRILK